jgi:hypothetical protein
VLSITAHTVLDVDPLVLLVLDAYVGRGRIA